MGKCPRLGCVSFPDMNGKCPNHELVRHRVVVLILPFHAAHWCHLKLCNPIYFVKIKVKLCSESFANEDIT